MIDEIPDCSNPKTMISGTFKRCLEWRDFGMSFETRTSSNDVVVVEEAQRLDNGVRMMKWSFGRSVSEVKFAFLARVTPDADDHDEGVARIDWQYSGHTCWGTFHEKTGVTTLQFPLQDSSKTVTYRRIDDDTYAVCIVDVDAERSSLQFGNMVKLA